MGFATGTDDPVEVAEAPCLDCEDRLVKRWRDRAGDRPGGLDDVWTCRGCRREYGARDYMLACRSYLENQPAPEAPVNVERQIVDLGPAGRAIFVVDPKWLQLPDRRINVDEVKFQTYNYLHLLVLFMTT